MIIFHKNYEGFESLSDIDRDVAEALDSDFNPVAENIQGEFDGTVRVVITYTPAIPKSDCQELSTSVVEEKSPTQKAIDLIVEYGGIDGAHHKDWVLDQVVRVLAGERYEDVVREATAGEDGPDTYEWNEGIAP